MINTNCSPLIALTFACDEEAAPFLERITVVKKRQIDKYLVWQGSLGRVAVLVVRTGVGRRNAANALAALLRNYHPQLVLSCGSCAGLESSLEVGDLAVLSEIVGASHFEPSTSVIQATRRVAAHLAKSIQSHLWYKAFYDADTVLTTPEEKAAIAHSGAWFADMESAAIAEVCTKAQVPWGTVRVVSDAGDDDLPLNFNDYLDERGLPQKLAIVWQVVQKPSLIGPLLAMGQTMKVIGRRLADLLVRLLPELSASINQAGGEESRQ